MRQSLFRSAGPFKVVSRANGTLEIQPGYAEGVPPECRDTMQGTHCPKCDCLHIYGVMGRMALANEIEEVLNRFAVPRRVKHKS